MRKAKWFVFASLAATVPFAALVTGCGGGSGGGVGQGTFQPSRFAGVLGNGTVRKAGINIGNVAFTVAADGRIAGTLSGTVITGSAVRAVPKAAVPTTVAGNGVIGSDGTFSLVFDVRVGDENGVIIFRGCLVDNGGTLTATDLVLDSPFPAFSGTYDLGVTTPVPDQGGGPSAGSSSFTIADPSGSNAIDSAFTSSTATVTAQKAGGKVTSLIINFHQISGQTLRTVRIAMGDGMNEMKTGTVAIGNGAGVEYNETSVTGGYKRWTIPGTGSVTLKTLTATSATLQVNGVRLTAAPMPEDVRPASGSFTLSGSGSVTFQ